jgi:hypothetical protein
MGLGPTTAANIANESLTFYVRGKALLQKIQDRPLLKALNERKQTFPGGKDYVSQAVQGDMMSAVSGFFAGYSADDALVFKLSDNTLRAYFAWKEVHAGLWINWTELKMDGITINDGGKMKEHSQTDLVRLVPILQARLDDFGESWAQSMNLMLWKDGTQDSSAIPGILSILPDVNNTSTIGGLSQSTYSWWRHRVSIGIQPSESTQTLCKELRKELRQLRRYGGRPDIVLAGSAFIEALESEVQAKGYYTQEGFINKGKNDIGMADISLRGLGTFVYDPTLDDLGLSKRCYVIDGRRLKLWPMEGEENKVLKPERPYNYLVFLQSMTYTGALCSNQMNCHGVYGIA